MMKIFSVIQRLHLFVIFEYGLVRAIIFQDTAKSVLVSFRDQLCLLNLVAFLLFSFHAKKITPVLQANFIVIYFSKIQNFLQRRSASPYLAMKNHYGQCLFVSFPEETKLLLSAMSPAVPRHHKFQNQPVGKVCAV